MFIAGYYAAECYCEDGANCDGVEFTEGNPRRCTARKLKNAQGRAVVSITICPP